MRVMEITLGRGISEAGLQKTERGCVPFVRNGANRETSSAKGW